MRLHLSSWLMVAAGGLLLPVQLTAADDSTEGVVRLGSARTASSAEADSAVAQQVGFHTHHQVCGDPACSYGCPAYGGCPSACGYGACDPCSCGHCGNCKLCGLLHCLRTHPVGGCHYSPDHGWAPPGKHPRPRTAATYRRWFPGAWTGEGYGDSNYRYPMVYTPTDTTQLGFYYQRVPVWQQRAGMIPPVPHPEQFHVPDFGGCGSCGHGYGHEVAYGASYGEVVSDYPISGGYAGEHGSASGPIDSAPTTLPSTPAPTPSPNSDAPPYVPPMNAPAPEAPPAAPRTFEQSASTPFLYPMPQR